MMATSVLSDQIQQLDYGRLVGDSLRLNQVSHYCIDSRQAKPGSLFFALSGERTNGHRYLGSVFDNGALGACVSEEEFVKKEMNWEVFLQKQIFLWVVPDTLKAMQQLAALRMKQKSFYRIGVTGSNGKTTTKELFGSIIRLWKKSFVTPGNYNSEIGLPLSILLMQEDPQIALFEMGTNQKGEIALLADIVRPDMAIITNIGRAHIGPLGSQYGIALEKRSIFNYQSSDGFSIVPADDSFKEVLLENTRGQILEFSMKDEALKIVEDRGLDGYLLEYENMEINFHLSGRYNLLNLLAVLKGAFALQIPREIIKKGIEAVTGFAGRGELLRYKDVSIFKDCYNANLDSMKALLTSLKDMEGGDKAVLVLGAMKELGQESLEMHRQLGTYVLELNPPACFLVGEEAMETKKYLEENNYQGNLLWAPEVDQIFNKVKNWIKPGDLLVLKGSRSVALEKLCDIFDKE